MLVHVSPATSSRARAPTRRAASGSLTTRRICDIRLSTSGSAQSGEFVIPDPHMAVLGILGMANYSYQWLKPDGAKTPAEIADLFTDMVLSGIEARPTSARARTKLSARLA